MLIDTFDGVKPKQLVFKNSNVENNKKRNIVLQ